MSEVDFSGGQLQQLQQDYLQQLIKETAEDFVDLFVKNPEQNISLMKELVYGVSNTNKNNQDSKIASVNQLIDENSILNYLKSQQYLRDAEKVANRLTGTLNGTLPLTPLPNDYYVKLKKEASQNSAQKPKSDKTEASNSPINHQTDSPDQQSQQQQMPSGEQVEQIVQKEELTEITGFGRLSREASKQPQIKSQLSSQVEQLISKASLIFWDYDMERLGYLENQDDIDGYFSSIQEELQEEGVFSISQSQIASDSNKFFTNSADTARARRLPFENIRPFILHLLTSQAVIPMYQI